jgi:hypothetical protein
VKNKTIFSQTGPEYFKNCPFITNATGHNIKEEAKLAICSAQSSIFQNNNHFCQPKQCESPARKCYICIQQGAEGKDTRVKNYSLGLCLTHEKNGKEMKKEKKSPAVSTAALIFGRFFEEEGEKKAKANKKNRGMPAKKEPQTADIMPAEKEPLKERGITMVKIGLANFQIKVLEEIKKGVDANNLFLAEKIPETAKALGQKPQSIVACLHQLIRAGMIKRPGRGIYLILNEEYEVKNKTAAKKEKKRNRPAKIKAGKKSLWIILYPEKNRCPT